MKGSRFITDMGHAPVVKDETTGETTTLGRYGVWGSVDAYRKAEVIALGNDLDALQAEYGPNLPVYGMLKGSERSHQP